MKPIKFAESNIVFAKDQPEYLPLPAWKGADGTVVSCWKFDWKERIKLLLKGTLWLTTLTFNQSLQPQRPDVNYPFVKNGK